MTTTVNLKKKPYQKPGWEKQELFEKFAMACCKMTGSCSVQSTSSHGAGAHYS